MQHYVLGFAFDKRYNNVLMITKTKPDWQAGLLNGIGGKIEPFELPAAAMVREFKEEANIDSIESDWQLSTMMYGTDWTVFVYFTDKLDIDTYKSMTEEVVTKRNVHGLLSFRDISMSNIPWLISYILDSDVRNGKINTLNVTYK